MVTVWHTDNCVMWLEFLVRKCWSAVLCFFFLSVCSSLTLQSATGGQFSFSLSQFCHVSPLNMQEELEEIRLLGANPTSGCLGADAGSLQQRHPPFLQWERSASLLPEKGLCGTPAHSLPTPQTVQWQTENSMKLIKGRSNWSGQFYWKLSQCLDWLPLGQESCCFTVPIWIPC